MIDWRGGGGGGGERGREGFTVKLCFAVLSTVLPCHSSERKYLSLPVPLLIRTLSLIAVRFMCTKFILLLN